MRVNEAKAMLGRGELVVGTLVFEFKTAGIGAIASNAGADFVLFDTEHTGWSWETIGMVIAGMRATKAVPLVRVPVATRSYISRPLDLGAMGLMVPMVASVEQAEEIVRWAKYPPAGVRGAAFGVAHDDYKAEGNLDTMRSSNEQVLLIGQIETAEGLTHVDRIAEVEGLDVLWVGHYDLTNSMGIPGQFDHPDYLEALERVADAAKRNGKSAGFMVSSVEEAQRMIERGYRCLGYGGDLWIYGGALREGIGELRASDGVSR